VYRGWFRGRPLCSWRWGAQGRNVRRDSEVSVRRPGLPRNRSCSLLAPKGLGATREDTGTAAVMGGWGWGVLGLTPVGDARGVTTPKPSVATVGAGLGSAAAAALGLRAKGSGATSDVTSASASSPLSESAASAPEGEPDAPGPPETSARPAPLRQEGMGRLGTRGGAPWKHPPPSPPSPTSPPSLPQGQSEVLGLWH